MGIEFKSIGSFNPAGTLTDDYSVLLATATPGVYEEASLLQLQTFVVADLQTQIDTLTNTPGKSIWPTARTLTLGGVATGSTTFDGSGNMSLAVAVSDGALTTAAVDGLASSLISLQSQINARPGKYAANIGDGVTKLFTVTHSLNTKDVLVQITNLTTSQIEFAVVKITTVNQVTVEFSAAPSASQYRVVVLG